MTGSDPTEDTVPEIFLVDDWFDELKRLVAIP